MKLPSCQGDAHNHDTFATLDSSQPRVCRLRYITSNLRGEAAHGQTPKAYLFPAGANGAAGGVADRPMHNAVFAKQTGVLWH